MFVSRKMFWERIKELRCLFSQNYDLTLRRKSTVAAPKAGQVFDQKHLKENYSIDGYFSVLGQPVDARQVQSIAYWYSMRSHRRDGLWKGFVQVDLDPKGEFDRDELEPLVNEIVAQLKVSFYPRVH